MTGQNGSIMSQLRWGALCAAGLDSARLAWAHQLSVSELSPAVLNATVLRNSLTCRDLVWSYGSAVSLVLPLNRGQARDSRPGLALKLKQ